MNKKNIDEQSLEYYGYIQEGNDIWVENPNIKNSIEEDPYIIKTILKIDKNKRIVTLTDNSTIQFKQTLEIINGKNINVDDMAYTKNINEMDLLYNLKNRLNEKKTFTNVGPTLIIVNPFSFIENIYNHEKIEYYKEKHEKENPDLREKITEPHLYDLVLISIRDLLKKNAKNQSLIISGESGAGKTEATKNAMECITYYFSKFKINKNNDNEISLEKKILNCNPILEAFGNAKTIRNDNSSRFGKYVKIKLNNNNVIVGASMITYLLEKSRICELNSKERNYHIFYYLLKGANDDLLSELFLKRDFKYYKYLWQNINENQVFEVSSINDKECFDDIINCFKSTNFTDNDIKTIFKVVSSVLLLGNIKFKINNNICICENEDILNNICTLLKVDKNKLETSLTRKYLPIQKVFGGFFKEEEIKNFTDALAKDLYNKLFLWIIKKLNRTLDSSLNNNDIKYIGLLDIFGFECFDNINSIEQLCINYTNEQLQQLYIKDIFESDKLEFKKENLEEKIYLLNATYKDNKDVIRLIKIFFNRLRDLKEDKQIYDMVKNFDNDIKKPPKNDKRFPKIKQNKFSVPKFSSLNFTVEHTAKNVIYNSKNFIEKNKDEIKESVIDCLIESQDEIIRMIYTNTTSKEEFEEEKNNIFEERKSVNKIKITNKYLGMKFCNEMKNLKQELKLCDHHYVRCLKPNEEKKPFLFYSNFVFNQIQYLGILATIQVRKNGFPIRRLYNEFYENFKYVIHCFINFDENINFVEICKGIIKELLGNDYDEKKIEEVCLFGKNKIFIKQDFNLLLENKKKEILNKKIHCSNVIKSAIKYLKKTNNVYKIRNSITNIQNYFKINQSKIDLIRKKNIINIIQSFYFTNQENENFKNKIDNYKIIQNNLKIIHAKYLISQKKNLLQFLKYRIQIYIKKISKIQRENMRLFVQKIIENTREKIMYIEYNKIWKKLNPFFISLLIRKKNTNLVKKAKILARENMFKEVMGRFQLSCFLYKIEMKKDKTKKILNYASCKIFQNYYKNLKKNIIIIQQYINVKLNKKEIFDKINSKYFLENSLNNIENENKNILKNIFPNYTSQNNSNNKIKNKLLINSNIKKEFELIPVKILTSRNQNKLNLLKNSIQKTLNNTFNEIKKNPNLPEFNYYFPIIKIFAKILDIDILTNNYEYTDYDWSEEFDKIYKKNIKNDTPIQIINLGNCHSILINNEGKVYSWGWNNYSQCGDFSLNTNINNISKNNNLNNSSYLPILNYKKNNIDIPLNYNNIQNTILGDDYTILLDKTGSLISFGNNDKGQLGMGNNLKTNYPQFNKKFQNEILDIKSTENMNIFLTKKHDIYIYILSKNENLIIPKKLSLNKKLHIEKISTGKNFAILLNKNGICYSIGNNTFNECGIENDKNFNIIPKEIISLSNYNERIIQIKCGFKHVVCVSIIGNVYSWGNNSFGQLGRKNSILNKPSIIDIKNEKGNKEKIIQISAGFRSSFFLTNNREIYYCGILNEKNYSFLPKKFDLNIKNSEIGNEKEFGIVRILCTFNRKFSIFYASVADVRSLNGKFNNHKRVDEILNSLAEKWIDEKIDGPFIHHISKYFSSNFMKIKKKNYNE